MVRQMPNIIRDRCSVDCNDSLFQQLQTVVVGRTSPVFPGMLRRIAGKSLQNCVSNCGCAQSPSGSTNTMAVGAPLPRIMNELLPVAAPMYCLPLTAWVTTQAAINRYSPLQLARR